MNQNGPLVIRKALPSDWASIRRICCETGSGGKPIDKYRWPFFSEYWVGPYERLEPDWGYVAEIGDTIIGYLTGCDNTEAFRKKRLIWFNIPLLFKVAFRAFARTPDTRRFIRRTLKIETGPEDRFSKASEAALKDFPAHLHINLTEGYRGLGTGGKLIQKFLDDLKDHNIPGVHLYCGQGPVEFYTRQGFNILERIEYAQNVPVFLMTIKCGQQVVFHTPTI